MKEVTALDKNILREIQTKMAEYIEQEYNIKCMPDSGKFSPTEATLKFKFNVKGELAQRAVERKNYEEQDFAINHLLAWFNTKNPDICRGDVLCEAVENVIKTDLLVLGPMC